MGMRRKTVLLRTEIPALPEREETQILVIVHAQKKRNRLLGMVARPATPQRDAMLKALSRMARYLHSNPVPPSKAKPDGSVEDPKSSVGFSAALLPYLTALGEKNLEEEQMARMHSEFNQRLDCIAIRQNTTIKTWCFSRWVQSSMSFGSTLKATLNWVGSMSECHLLSLHFTAG
jgi:hypothetical protein